jgi:predicted GIY-YIG superfamily endonuclease
MSSILYLLHFESPLDGGRRPQHYLGATTDLERRIEDHANGRGRSALVNEVVKRGISFKVVRTWTFDAKHDAFQEEARMKRKKRSYRWLCPVCSSTRNK